ncbi:MAG: hypothetical protein WCI67_00950 [Chloroflexales bacterium]
MTLPPIPAHVRKLIAHLQALPITAPPPPWTLVTCVAVGGLLAVGYAEQSDLLLVISSQGRGIFDCLSGTRIARDQTDAAPFYDEITLRAQGFGPLEGQVLPIAGLCGGGLPNATRDGWHLQAIPLPWPHHRIVLEAPFRSMYHDPASATCVGDDGACELRAAGFSPTGQSFVIATSCDLMIIARR